MRMIQNSLFCVVLAMICARQASGFFFTPSMKSKGTRISGSLNHANHRTITSLSQNKRNSDASNQISMGILSRRNVIKAISVSVVGIPILLEAYARSGSIQTTIDIFQADGGSVPANDAKDITIIFHGAGGQDENTDNLLKVLRDKASSSKGLVKMVDWSADSADILKASVKGSKIGSNIGHDLRDMIQRDAKGRNIHIIGISVGAFAANSLVQTLDSKLDPISRKNTLLQLTLLDPFQQKAVLGLNYGNRKFGIGSDYAQHYLNTDDPVPSTNAPLQYCSTVDVTSLRPTEIFGHDWPLIYYTEKLKESEGNGFIPIEERKKIGSLDVL